PDTVVHLPCDSFSLVFLRAKELRRQKSQFFPGFFQFDQGLRKLPSPLMNAQFEIVMGDSEFFPNALQLAYISPGSNSTRNISKSISDRTGTQKYCNFTFIVLFHQSLLKVRRDLSVQCGFPDRLQQTGPVRQLSEGQI